MRSRRGTRATAAALGLALAATPAPAALADELGRNESRVYSAPFALFAGASVQHQALPERLGRQGYRRVAGRPTSPGEYFHGTEVFWVYRRACHAHGRDQPARLVGLDLDPRSGRVRGRRAEDGSSRPWDEEDAWLEPELLAESLDNDRADRVPVALASLPDHVWRAVLAAEDARFFAHPGVDARAVARAALSNLRRGRVAEGGSTITQQLVKNRDLSPKRSVGRKASEAMRALALEAEYDKKEILQSYLDTVYLGNVDGLAVHGLGAAARVYFSKSAATLTLAEAAALAAMIQAPNRLSPFDDAPALRSRRDWILGRMAELEWASTDSVTRAKEQPVAARRTPPARSGPPHLLQWSKQEVAAAGAAREERGWGFLVETTVDPWLQELAERATRERLAALRAGYASLRRAPLEAALVALDARSGAVLAYVGGDPAARPQSVGIDRARLARRQPGSVVKPFVALEALERCGRRDPLTASSRIADEPIEIELPSGRWRPENFDHRFLGPVLLREALAESRNVPTVRIARWCGLAETAATFARAGFELPPAPPPSFVLGAVESTPLTVAGAYTVFATPGRRLEPFPVARIETSRGWNVRRTRGDSSRVADAATAYIVRDLLRTAVEHGSAGSGSIAGLDTAAKTGSSSGLRDAWFAGQAGSIVAVVWIGLDDGAPLGLTGAQAAGPLWRGFMAGAAPARPPHPIPRPGDVVEQWMQTTTGLRVHPGRADARPELYRRGTLPTRRRWWRVDEPMPVIR